MEALEGGGCSLGKQPDTFRIRRDPLGAFSNVVWYGMAELNGMHWSKAATPIYDRLHYWCSLIVYEREVEGT